MRQAQKNRSHTHANQNNIYNLGDAKEGLDRRSGCKRKLLPISKCAPLACSTHFLVETVATLQDGILFLDTLHSCHRRVGIRISVQGSKPHFYEASLRTTDIHSLINVKWRKCIIIHLHSKSLHLLDSGWPRDYP